MRYQDNQTKFTCIVNAKVAGTVALNAVLHATIGLSGEVSDEDRRLLDYSFAGGSFTSRISHYPVIVLQARNANQLRVAALQARDAGLAVNVFASSMLGATAQEQIDQTAATDFGGAELVAVAIYGDAIATNVITRKFSAFRNFSMEQEDAAR